MHAMRVRVRMRAHGRMLSGARTPARVRIGSGRLWPPAAKAEGQFGPLASLCWYMRMHAYVRGSCTVRE